MVKTEQIIPYQITVPAGTELNYGYHEDSDSVITNIPTDILVIGVLKNGALPVKLLQNGIPGEETLFFHQPEPKPQKT
ncbi:hypothetical protein A3D03_02595 [Candidatus Gottesmanbacteria bacterium RIFCSPHIGHO2_02_FULL_40_13]|uniref:Uncharacterized protein n=1 Tax=Candidatus Gottesmanbacteria bacterium RIFCSPHIGHO2_02_FULL_40_13 TaxID=1798384 RepID=A0A1F6A8V4_9BACT|nr:MAG: hypothetical protein A3D03_02595 [Candidatus Gottesmanbacteria bacterium RIFCSPHIGHO2_02_FULL_40_13]